jgi:hypothetical protein
MFSVTMDPSNRLTIRWAYSVREREWVTIITVVLRSEFGRELHHFLAIGRAVFSRELIGQDQLRSR